MFMIFFHPQGVNEQFELPVKKKSDICTIMYTSGTTGDPKGVMITNESILSLISGVNHHLGSINEEVNIELMHVTYFLPFPFGDSLGN